MWRRGEESERVAQHERVIRLRWLFIIAHKESASTRAATQKSRQRHLLRLSCAAWWRCRAARCCCSTETAWRSGAAKATRESVSLRLQCLFPSLMTAEQPYLSRELLVRVGLVAGGARLGRIRIPPRRDLGLGDLEEDALAVEVVVEHVLRQRQQPSVSRHMDTTELRGSGRTRSIRFSFSAAGAGADMRLVLSTTFVYCSGTSTHVGGK
jgi:hypothetical protein